MDELKKLFADLQKAFDAFKSANDERLSQIEARGTADPVLVETVNKANADISSLQAKIDEQQKQLRDVETAAARTPSVNGGEPSAEQRNAGLFFSVVRGRIVEASAADIETYRNYRRALNAYLRNGEHGMTPEFRNAMSVGSDPNGGFFVTPDVSGRIITLIQESSPVRQVADVVSISTDALEGINDLDEAGSGWVGETASRSETSTPEVGKYRIPVHEQYAEPRATQKVLDDASVDVEGWLARKIADKLAREEAKAFVNGDGVLKPRGFLTYAAGTPSKSAWNRIAQVNSGAAGAFAASNPGDKLIDLVFGLKAAYRTEAVFAMSRTTVAETRKLKDADGNYLWQPNFGTQQGATLLGYGIVEMEDMPAIAADSLSIAFGNFRAAYQIVDRQGIRVLRDPFTAKPYVKFYSTKRVGGDVSNFEALRIMKFAV